jgi:hypothetical protein
MIPELPEGTHGQTIAEIGGTVEDSSDPSLVGSAFFITVVDWHQPDNGNNKMDQLVDQFDVDRFLPGGLVPPDFNSSNWCNHPNEDAFGPLEKGYITADAQF